jgi:hypothetical protein
MPKMKFELNVPDNAKGRLVAMWVPTEVEEFQGPLMNFVQLMINKLYDNRHKNPPAKLDIRRMFERMAGEMLEAHTEVLNDKHGAAAHKELADVANFAMLIYMVARREANAKTKWTVEWGNSEPVGNPVNEGAPVGEHSDNKDTKRRRAQLSSSSVVPPRRADGRLPADTRRDVPPEPVESNARPTGIIYGGHTLSIQTNVRPQDGRVEDQPDPAPRIPNSGSFDR